MNKIEYDCYIKGPFCNPKCNDKIVFLINKDMTRRIDAEYLGNGSAKFEDEDTGYDIIVWEPRFYDNTTIPKKKIANFACLNCSKYIINRCCYLDDLLEEKKDNLILLSRQYSLHLEVEDLVSKRDELTKLIKNKRKEIDKLDKKINWSFNEDY